MVWALTLVGFSIGGVLSKAVKTISNVIHLIKNLNNHQARFSCGISLVVGGLPLLFKSRV